MNYDLADLKVVETESMPDWLNSEKPLVLYGAGNFGREVLTALRARGVAVKAFLDGNATEPVLRDGITIYPLDDPAAEKFVKEEFVVLLTIFNHRVDWSEIVRSLTSRGFSKIITPMEIFDAMPEIRSARYWIAPSSYYRENWSSFLEGESLWTDETSREIFRRILWFRAGRDLAAHPEPQLDCQYAPHDLPRWPEPVKFLDGGACVGEALQTLQAQGLQVGNYYGWEPDLANFEKLESYLQQKCPDLPATLFPCGLGSKTSVLSFASGQGTASAITASGDDKTIVLSADQAMRNQPVTLIKLDIEGAEIDALLGMRAMIERHRPGLAISVYHRADHMWRIPLLIKSWLPGGRHYLRSHAYSTFDVIYYWMP